MQNDRGNAGDKRQREPQSDLEREIADFLEQSRRGGAPAPRSQAESVEAYSTDDFVVAETAPETLRDHHLAPSAIDTQSLGHATKQPASGQTAYSQEEHTPEEFQYEEAETYNYDAEHSSQTPNAGASIAAMFREPEKVRNAFILGEIINRPKFPRRS